MIELGIDDLIGIISVSFLAGAVVMLIVMLSILRSEDKKDDERRANNSLRGRDYDELSRYSRWTR
jgi:hypothetical protein